MNKNTICDILRKNNIIQEYINTENCIWKEYIKSIDNGLKEIYNKLNIQFINDEIQINIYKNNNSNNIFDIYYNIYKFQYNEIYNLINNIIDTFINRIKVLNKKSELNKLFDLYISLMTDFIVNIINKFNASKSIHRDYFLNYMATIVNYKCNNNFYSNLNKIHGKLSKINNNINNKFSNILSKPIDNIINKKLTNALNVHELTELKKKLIPHNKNNILTKNYYIQTKHYYLQTKNLRNKAKRIEELREE